MIYCYYNYTRVPMRHATVQLLRKRTEYNRVNKYIIILIIIIIMTEC